MKIVRWAAVLVTVLFVLMNVGAAADSAAESWVRLSGGLLALAGAAAAVGLALDKAWGRTAVIAVGALNVVLAVAALLVDEPGGVVGIVVGGLAVVLGALYAQPEHEPARGAVGPVPPRTR
jgi:peptidoglycan/LPS O-acetylase OafA/YrhL